MKIWVLIEQDEGCLCGEHAPSIGSPHISRVEVSETHPPDLNTWGIWHEVTLPEEYEIWRK